MAEEDGIFDVGAMATRIERLREALTGAEQALASVRENFERGILCDTSGLGGTLSNMVVDAEVKARAVLESTSASPAAGPPEAAASAGPGTPVDS